MLAFHTTRKVWRAIVVSMLLALIGFGLWMVAVFASGEHHRRQAQHALNRQRYSQALEELKQALRFRPESAPLHLVAGRTARQAGQYQLAWDHLNQCRKLQKGVSEDQQLEEFMLRAQTGELDQVHSFLVPYLYEERPQTPLVLEALTHAYMRSYQSNLAWACLRRWLQLQPDNVAALFLRGVWFAEQLNPEAATADYQRALEIDPDRKAIRLVLAEALREERNFEAAANQYAAALRQEPHDFKGRVGLAQCYMAMGHVSDARPLLEAVYQEKPDDADVLWLKGRMELFDGRLQEAARFFRRALDHAPGHREACYHLLLCLQRLGQDDEANQQSALLKRIENDHHRLIEIATKEMNESPRNPALHAELGEIYLRLGVTERGLYWLRSALRIDPSYRRAHERLRDYYNSLGPEGKEMAEFHRQQSKRQITNRSSGKG
jgi:tetratricopeptide (TPR) repeat protein